MRKINWKKTSITTISLVVCLLIVWIIIGIFLFAVNIGHNQAVNFETYLSDLTSQTAIVLGFVLGFVCFIGLMIYFQIKLRWFFNNQAKANDYGNARWLTEAEFQNNTQHSSTKKPHHFGWVVKTKIKQKEIQMNYVNEQHALIVGTTRDGKTQTIVLPTIIHNLTSKEKPSMIITDPKGELFDKTAKIARKNGYKAYQLDFETFNGARWNPLKIIQDYWRGKAIDKAETEIDKLANIIFKSNQTAKSDPFWSDTASDLFSAVLIAYLIEQEQNNWQFGISFRDIALKMSIPTHKLLQWLNHYMKIDKHNALKIYMGHLQRENKTLDNIIMNAKTALKALKNRQFNKMTTGNDIRFDLITQENYVIYIKNEVEEKTFNFLNRLFLETLIKVIKKSKFRNNQKPVLFLLDEFANIPQISNFSQTLSTAGGYNYWFALIIQDLEQLKNCYQKSAETILANCALKYYVSTKVYQTATYFSKMCGSQTITSESIHKNIKEQKSTSFNKQQKPLIDENNLMRLPKFTQIIFLDRQLPYKYKSLPYYQFEELV